MKIILGTAQFGMDYGISNEIGKTSKKEIIKILKFADANGIGSLDTAPAYGDSEITLSNLLENNPELKFDIISKVPKVGNFFELSETIKSFDKTKALFGDNFKTYLVHNAEDIFHNLELSNFLRALKENNSIQKIGVSVYDEDEIRKIIKLPFIDVIQLPLNILDHRLIKSDILGKANEHGIEIHVRSIFLQGLFFLNKKVLSSKFPSALPHIKKIENIAFKYGLTVSDLALLFIYNLEHVDKIVIGVNILSQLKSNILALKKDYSIKVQNEILSKINFEDVNVLNPKLW